MFFGLQRKIAMFLFLSNTSRLCWRNFHSQSVSRTIYGKNKIYSNSSLCRAVSKQTMRSRLFCDKVPKRVTIQFLKTNGEIVKRRGRVGETIQEVVGQEDLVAQNVPDIPGYGVCGGTLSCSTCHIVFDPEDFSKLADKPTEEELDLIGYAPDNCATSRLGCCVKITEEMDGIVLKVPAYTKDQRDEFNR